MPGKAALNVKVDDQAMRELGRAIRKETDGKQLRKDLVAELRAAVAPGVSAVQGKLRAIPQRSATQAKPALGSYLAARVKPSIRLSGRTPGVNVRIGQTPNLRGFKMAARRLNRKSWRHRVYGRNVWVTQKSPIPGFFDDTLAAGRAQYRAAVVAALKKTSDRLTIRKFGGR
jgi:hypothetical protein